MTVGRLLEGQTAIVTGAAQGIGFAIARLFAAEGAAVLIADLDEAAAAEAAERIEGAATPPMAARCDVTSVEQIQAVVDRTVDHYGRLDVMVNNAGITRDATMRKMQPGDFDAVVAVHLRGAWIGTRAASIPMRAARRGSIVNLSSISGKIGNAGQTNYSAAKAGIVGLTKAAAKEIAHAGVRVNAVQPGLIRTPMTVAMREDVFAERERQIPMQRAGQPEEVANAVLFLASDLASYVTGTVLEVAGGRGI